MDSAAAQALVNDLGQEIEDLIVVLSVANMGLDRVRDWASTLPAVAENPDPLWTIGHGSPDEPGSVALGAWRKSRVVAGCAAGGEVRVRQSQQWLVMVHSIWEDNYRKSISIALGGDKKEDLTHPLFGDLNKMRNDAVHNKGIASQDRTGKCSTLKWFNPGDRISVTPGHLRQFIEEFRTTPFELPTSS